jgi:acyl-CoA thioesterase
VQSETHRTVPEFDRDVAVTALGDGRYAAAAPVTWCNVTDRAQGGFVAAQVLLAMAAEVGDTDRYVRAITAQYLRPTPAGDYSIETRVERRGRTMTNVTGRVVCDGATTALAMAVFAVEREGPDLDELPLPDVAGPTPSRVMEAEVPLFAYPFVERTVVQQREGGMPFSGSPGPMRTGGWLGFADPRPIDPVGLLVLCDATIMPWWVRLPEPVPTATVDYTLHFRSDLPRSYPHELVYGEFTTRLARGGFLDWDGVVWGPDGTVLCLARQQLVTTG